MEQQPLAPQSPDQQSAQPTPAEQESKTPHQTPKQRFFATSGKRLWLQLGMILVTLLIIFVCVGIVNGNSYLRIAGYDIRIYWQDLSRATIKKYVASQPLSKPSTRTTTVPSPKYGPTPTGQSSQYQLKLYTISANQLVEIVNLTQHLKQKLDSPGFNFYRSIIDNQKIYLSTDKQVVEYDLDTKNHRLVYQLKDQDYAINTFHSNSNLLTVDIYNPDDEHPGSKFTNNYMDLVDLNNLSVKRQGPHQPTLYGGLDYQFKTTRGDHVISTFGGDSCAVFGTLRLITPSSSRDLLDVGDGCNFAPRFIGTNPATDSLILASVISQDWDEIGDMSDPQSYKGFLPDKLYTRNVYSDQQTTLLDFRAANSGRMKSYNIDRANHQLSILFFNRQLWTIPLHQPQNTTKQTLNSSIDLTQYYDAIHNNKLYSLDKTNNGLLKESLAITVTDAGSGLATAYRSPTTTVSPTTDQARLIGFWNGQPLIIYQTP